MFLQMAVSQRTPAISSSDQLTSACDETKALKNAPMVSTCGVRRKYTNNNILEPRHEF